MKTNDDLVLWLTKRRDKCENDKDETEDLSEKKRLGAKAAAFKEVLTYLNTHPREAIKNKLVKS